MEPRKTAICDALARFIRQRPGMEFGNYGDVKAYRSELRSITKDRHHAETLLRAVMAHDSITADDLIRASEGAYSGRLTISDPKARTEELRTKLARTGDEHVQRILRASINSESVAGVRIDYVTGQYFPTEYRRAVCAVLASALWSWARANAMPPPYDWDDTEHGRTSVRYSWAPNQRETFLSAGDWLRAHFRREFGKGIASRWFS